MIISVFELNSFAKRVATSPSAPHAGAGKYCSHYAEEGAAAGGVGLLSAGS